MTYTFEQLRDALRECTSYDLQQVVDDDQIAYALIDPSGDQDGDLFYELADVEDYITNNEQVDDYLYEAMMNS
jgi:hypothetical protein